jgi:hypothetical protein
MVALVERIAREGGTTRAAVRKETAKPKAGRPKAYIFSYKVIAASNTSSANSGRGTRKVRGSAFGLGSGFAARGLGVRFVVWGRVPHSPRSASESAETPQKVLRTCEWGRS